MSSPWAPGSASPSQVTFSPPPPATFTTPSPPPVSGSLPRPRRRWPWTAAALFVVVGLAAGVASAVTYMAMQGSKQAAPSLPPPSSPAPSAPQFSSTEVATAKQHVCHVFETSVGHEGQGGFRVEGKINLPVNLQSVTSAIAVEHALGPAVPPDVNAAGRRYIDTTLDAMTAAMGRTPIDEVNRLTRLANAAIDAFADACGLPQ